MIRIKSKTIISLMLALLLSCTIFCGAAFAAPTEEDSAETSVSEVAGSTDNQQEQEEDSDPFGPSYFIKGGIVIGIGAVFYAVLAIKTRKK